MSRPTRTAIVMICIVVASLTQAGERPHTVVAGESASAIARRYYGDFESTELLLEYNGKIGSALRPGEMLKVPYAESHQVEGGDTWSVLAKRYLGDADAYRTIAQLNGLDPRRPLQVGQQIVMPMVLSYELKRGDTLGVLAERFYDDDERTRVIQQFNGIDNPRRLSVGRTIRIPLIEPRLIGKDAPSATPAPPQAEPEVAQQQPEPEPVARYAAELAGAARAFSVGDYDRVNELLAALGGPVQTKGTELDLAEWWRLQSFVHVAFDRNEEACAAYRSWTRVTPDVTLDPDLVSPKIRQILAGCPAGS